MRVTNASSPPGHTISVAVPEKAVAGFWPASSMLSKKGGLHIVNVKASPSCIAGISTPAGALEHMYGLVGPTPSHQQYLKRLMWRFGLPSPCSSRREDCTS